MPDKMITVVIDGVTSQMPESELIRSTGTDDFADSTVEWVEYRLPLSDGIPVHRSAHVTIKQPAVVSGVANLA